MAENTSNSTAPERSPLIDKSLLDACIHCGLCLPACPTYLATGREMESPRGRIYLLAQWSAGELELDERLAGHVESCLGCFGCQTACPSGVNYEEILSHAKPAIASKRPEYQRKLLRFIFEKILPDYPRLRQSAKLLKLWQKLDGRKYLKALAGDKKEGDGSPSGWRGIFMKLLQCDSFMPELGQWSPLPVKSWASGEKRGVVQFFSGCVMDVFYNHVNHAAIKLLKAQSQVVEVPAQTCCGALAFHAGEVDLAKDLARRNLDYFQSTEGAIAVTSAGCGAMLKYYGELLHDHPEDGARAAGFAKRVKDITEILAENQFRSREPVAMPGARKIAYHAACHLAHAQGVREAPQKLIEQMVEDCNQSAIVAKGVAEKLAADREASQSTESKPAESEAAESKSAESKKAPPNSESAPVENVESNETVETIEAVPLREAEHCCGSAGIYNLLNTAMSLKVLERKMDCIKATGADTVVTTNPGCMLQLQAGARERNLELKVEHLCETLARVYCAE